MEQNIENTQNKPYKRKRKKTFLQNARKYAKKGYYGRGSHMDADVYQYFVQIMEAYKRGFDSEEDKVVFVNNVFKQTEEKELECCNNQVGCRVVETLLPFANHDVLKRFMQIFSDDLRPLCKDRFATHVLEALLNISCIKSFSDTVETDLQEYYRNFLVKVSKFLLNNLEDYVWDTYGSHVIRTCLENLSLIEKEDKNKNKINETNNTIQNTAIPEEFEELVQEYAKRIISWPQFKELCQNELTSGFLQVMLKSLQKTDKKLLKKYIDKFLELFVNESEDQKDSNKLPEIFLSKSTLMLLETSIQVAPKKKYTQIYAKCFSGKLVKLSTLRSTNFAVQKLISCCQEKCEFDAIFDELSEHFSEIIEVGHSGIILAIAQTCKRLTSKQGPFVQNIFKAFDCLEPDDRQNSIILCLSSLLKYEEIQKGSDDNLAKEKFVKLNGTLIIQTILMFNKPIKIVNAILNMEIQDLKKLFSNCMGCHIADAYVESPYVGEKSREKLVRKMQGTYQDLASCKFGSRSFEALFNSANLKGKLHIMEEITHKDASWSNSEFGKIIAGKVNLLLFKRNKEEWKTWLQNKDKNKVEDLFKDVLK